MTENGDTNCGGMGGDSQPPFVEREGESSQGAVHKYGQSLLGSL
jgi:hypothetical protein